MRFRVLVTGEVRVHVEVEAASAEDAMRRAATVRLIPRNRGWAVDGAPSRVECEDAGLTPVVAVTDRGGPDEPSDEPGDGGWET